MNNPTGAMHADLAKVLGITPGPWTLETVRTSCGICHKIGPFPWRDERPNHACVYVDYPSSSDPVTKELLANAKLIASAPDMAAELAQLRSVNTELVNALEQIIGAFCDPDADTSDLMKLLAKARATGGQTCA